MNGNETSQPPGAETKLESVARKMEDLSSQAARQFREGVQRGRDRVGAMEDAVLDRSRYAARHTDYYVHENPWKAVGIALGAGVVLGLLLRSK